MSECIKEENDCKFCGRAGLPILPLRLAYVPDKLELRNSLIPEPEPQFLPLKKNPLDDLGIDSPYASTPKVSPLPLKMTGVTDAPNFPMLFSGHYLLRTITEGYIFIWHGDNKASWSAYDVSRNGLFKEIALEDGDGAKNDTPPEFKCCTPFHQYEASLISIKDPEKKTQPIWIGYSRVWWTTRIRNKIADDKKLRTQLMTPLDAKDLAQGGKPDERVAYRVDREGKKIPQHVQEYWNLGHKDAERAFAPTHTAPEPEVTAALNRSIGDAKHVANVMYRISETHGGIVLALRDPIGVVQDISAGRNYRLGKFAHYAESIKRQLFVAQTIKSLKESLHNSGKSKVWNIKFEDRVKYNEVESVLNTHVGEQNAINDICARTDSDWANWMQTPYLIAALKTYDANNNRTLMSLQRDVAYCLQGAGKPKEVKPGEKNDSPTTNEQRVLDRILNSRLTGDDYSPIWLAQTGSKDFIEFLKGISPADIQSISSSALDALTHDQALTAVKKVADKYNKWRETHKGAVGDPGFAAMIAQTLSPRVSAAMAQGLKEAHTFVLQMTFVAYFRVNVINIEPAVYQVTDRQMVYDIFRVAELEAVKAAKAVYPRIIRSRNKRLGIRLNRLAKEKAKIAFKSTFNAISTAIGKQYHRDAPRAAAFMPKYFAPKFYMPPVISDLKPAVPIADIQPVLSPAQGFWSWSRSMSGASSVFGGLLLIWNMDVCLDNLRRAKLKGNKKELEDAELAMTSGVLALTGLVMTSAAGFLEATAPKGLTGMSRLKLASKLMLIGTAISSGAAFLDAYRLREKALETQEKGGNPLFHYAASFVTFSGGLLAIAGLMVAVGSGAATAGATASATILGLPVGWVLFIAGLFCSAIGIGLSWLASDREVSDLELWVSRSCFGKIKAKEGEPYASLEEEIVELQDVLCVIKLDVEWIDNYTENDQLEIKAAFFGFDAEKSDFCLSVIFRSQRIQQRWGPITQPYPDYKLRLKTSVLSKDQDLNPALEKKTSSTSSTLPSLSDMPVTIHKMPNNLKTSEGALHYHVTLDFNEKEYHITSADIKLEYRPDKHEPDWVVTFGKTNTVKVID
jgi:hypothetical protein